MLLLLIALASANARAAVTNTDRCCYLLRRAACLEALLLSLRPSLGCCCCW